MSETAAVQSATPRKEIRNDRLLSLKDVEEITGMCSRVASDRALGRRKVGAEAAERMRDAIASGIEANGPAPSILGVIDGEKYTAKDVADMLDLCEELDIRSMDDFRDASAGPMATGTRERLRASWRLARSLGHLPKQRQRSDGRRLEENRSHHGSESSLRGHSSYTPSHSAPARSYSHVDIGER